MSLNSDLTILSNHQKISAPKKIKTNLATNGNKLRFYIPFKGKLNRKWCEYQRNNTEKKFKKTPHFIALPSKLMKKENVAQSFTVTIKIIITANVSE